MIEGDSISQKVEWPDSIEKTPARFFSQRRVAYRHKLDELIDGCKDGRDFLKQRHGIVVKSCACSLDSKIPAGYLCILSNRPVSKENSIGGIAWIPSGADLARVSKDIYDELSVWLGF